MAKKTKKIEPQVVREENPDEVFPQLQAALYKFKRLNGENAEGLWSVMWEESRKIVNETW